MNNLSVPNRRPPAVAAVAVLFIVSGAVGFIYHARELFEQDHSGSETVWVLFLRVLAVVTGLFVLRGANWARWLGLAWVAYHVALSIYHSVSETLVHLALLLVIAVLLFLPKSSAFFHHGQPGE